MSSGVRSVLFAFLALLAICVPVAVAAKGDITLVSQDAGAGGNAGGSEASISSDGRFVAFASSSSDLAGGGDEDAFRDIFLKDLQTGTTEHLSRVSSLDGDAPANGDNGAPSISGDGRFTAFTSSSTNLPGGGPPDNNAASDIYLRDAELNHTILISRATGINGARANGSSSAASISGDGNFVAFVSGADNLSNEDDNNVSNIFVRDIANATTTLISRADGVAGAGSNGNSSSPSFSFDGNTLAFDSAATNLSDADNDGATDVFVRTIDDKTTLISRQSDATGGAGGDGSSLSPSISGDGQVIAFRSAAENLATDDDPAAQDSIFVRDTATGVTALVSRQSRNDGAAPSTGSSLDPAISDDGRFVGFRSDSDNLFPGTTDDAAEQIYVRDLLGETTKLVSRAAGNGAASDGNGESPSLSADGHFIAFSSFAENLSDIDSANTRDVFVFDLGVPTDPDFTGPSLEVTAKQQQKLKKPITLTVKADEPATFTLGGTAKAKAKKKKAKPKTLQLGSTSGSAAAAGAAVTLTLKPPKQVAKKLKKSSKANVKLELAAVDETGNRTTQPVKIKLR